jgi:FtsP/CotA-like multicopper oxidase with cupredoxin domain
MSRIAWWWPNVPLAVALVLTAGGPDVSHSQAVGGLTQPRCPAQQGDAAFLPCAEMFFAHSAVGKSLVPYAGQELPSDGPLLDLLSGDRAVRAVNGLLETTLTVTSGTPQTPVRLGSKPYPVITYQGAARLGGIAAAYDGMFPGRSLVADPGDTIRLEILDRRVPGEEMQKSPTAFDPTNPVPDLANIHFHGVLTSPTGRADNVYRAFAPGGDYPTEIRIPKDHDQGVNWYHPHYHSSTAQQVYGGMAGIVQIGRAIDTNLRAEYAPLPERILVLTGMSLAPSLEHPGMFEIGPTANGTSPTLTDPNPAAAAGGPSIAPRYAPTYFVNGQVNPIIAMRPGETQVWTVANFSPFAAYSLGIYRIGSDGRIAASAPLFRSTLLAQDGNDYVTPVTTLFTKQRDIMKDTFLAPGGRLTWGITAPAEPGDYYVVNVRDSAYTNQVPNLPAMLSFQPPRSYVPSVIMATVRVQGAPVTTPPPGGGPPVPEPAELAKAPAVLRDQVAFDYDEVSLRGRINFGSFPDLAVVQSYSGDVERWVVSTFSQVAHPFHIHQGQFVIEKIEYYWDQALTQLRTDLPQNPLVNDVPRELDTFAFPGRSKAYIKLRTSRFVGKFVMHCHLLLHEDDGMMLAVRVVPPRSEVLTAVGARRGERPTVSLAHAVTGETVGSFMPYGRVYRGGVGAAVGDVLGDGRAHVVTIPLSGSPLVRVFERTQLQRPRLELRPFDGSGDGGSVAIGDIDGDGVPEILVGSGKGRKPMVAVYRLEVAPDGSPKARLMFEVPVLDDGYRSAGVRVAAADVDGDNWDDIVVANGPGAANRVMVWSGQALSQGAAAKDAVIVDAPGLIPGTQGLNIAADVLGGGFAAYPPITMVGVNPPVPRSFQALIAVTPAVALPSPQITLFRYLGAGGHGAHGHAASVASGRLLPVSVFSPFPGETGPSEGLVLTTGLTVVADPNNPLVGLVSARGAREQRVSYFTRSGEITTQPWATARPGSPPSRRPIAAAR